jgi:hypothetical protein
MKKEQIIISCDGTYTLGGLVDEHGNQITRTPATHPYSYDGFVTHRLGKNEEAKDTIYSDRLLQWDYQKYNELSEKHFGNKSQNWYDRQPEKIEAFLRDWCEAPNLKLVLVMEYCNQSSGYPVWRFDFNANIK